VEKQTTENVQILAHHIAFNANARTKHGTFSAQRAFRKKIRTYRRLFLSIQLITFSFQPEPG